MNKFISAYSKKNKVALSFLDKDGKCLPSRTKQAFKHECDINNIIKKYDKTGVITHVNKTIARYGDFTEKHEYGEALSLVNQANESFSSLPSEIRRKFGDNPDEYIEFVTNPDNMDEMVKLGMAVQPAPEVKPEPIEVTIKETPKSE